MVDPLNVENRYTTGVVGGHQVSAWNTPTRDPNGNMAYGTWWQPEYGQVLNTNAMAGQLTRNYLGNANESVTGMVDTARQGVGAASAGAATAEQARIQNSEAAARIAADAASLRGFAPRLQNDAAAQRGYAGTFSGMAATAQGQAAPWLAAGQDLLGLNAGATGMAGEWIRNYNALSPDSLVSFAASDAQRSIENTRGQMARTLSRSGVSPSSPAYIAALGEARKYEQALLAGVKTRARLLGLKEQSGALQQGLQMALGATGAGQQFVQQALAAQQAASAATGAATGADTQAGGMFAKAGDLEAQAGGLTAQGAQISIGAQNALTGAYGTLVGAQQSAAEYYSTQASSVLGLLQSGANSALSALFS